MTLGNNAMSEKEMVKVRRTVQACLNVTLLLTSVVGSILLVEVGLRLVGYTATVLTHGRSYYPRLYFKADPVNGFDIAENFPESSFGLPDYLRSYGTPFSVSSNSVGCRDGSFDTEDGHVLLLGDSLTWGYVPLEQTWGTTLEHLIGTRVLKCGVGGYGPRQERRKLETVTAQVGRPRVVIVGYCVGNDLLDDYLHPGSTVVDGYLVTKIRLADLVKGGRLVHSREELEARLKSILEQKPAGFVSKMKEMLTEHSVLYARIRKSNALRSLAAQMGFSEPAPPAQVSAVFYAHEKDSWLHQAWEEHLDNIRKLKLESEAKGATFLLVIIPTAEQVYEFLRPQGDGLEWEYPNKRLAEYFKKEGVPFLDLLPELRQFARQGWKPNLDAREDLYWPEDGHLNVKGNRLMGLLVAQWLLQNSSLRLPDEAARLATVKNSLGELAPNRSTSARASAGQS